MSVTVVGFDIGTSTSYIAVARGGGIETITNEYSDRATPTFVAFDDKRRLLGTAAKLQHACNIKNTVYNFLPLVGKRFSDDLVAKERRILPYPIKEYNDGRIGIQVAYEGERVMFTPEQMVAMQLTKLKEITEAALTTKVVDVVINVPTYCTDAERRAMLDATRIAGLNCVRLVNDTSAIGIAYGLYNKDLPPPDQPPRVVAFTSVGYTSTQVAVCAFTTSQMKILATASDPHLGGRDFDMVLFEKFAQEFKDATGQDVKSSPKATIRLLQECEKIKKVMSANSSEVPMNVECLMNDRDLTSRIKRSDFEELCSDLIERFEKTVLRCLNMAQLQPSDVHFVELVGGSIRIPALKGIVASTFGQEGKTTLNLDEAVARGCALQAAICSPAFKVRDFAVIETCPYAITLYWDREENSDQSTIDNTEPDGTVAVSGKETSIEIFPHLYAIPSTRQLTLNRSGPFVLEARYSNPAELPNQNSAIGSFKVLGILPTKANEQCKVRIKARVNSHGIFTVSQAQIAEKYEKEVEVEEVEPTSINGKESTTEKSMDIDAPNNGDGNEQTSSAETPGPDGQTLNDAAPVPVKPIKKKIKKLVTRYKDLPMEAAVMQYTENQLVEFAEREAQLIQQEKLEYERSNAKNAVEEYVYEMRDKLQGSFEKFVTDSERSEFTSLLNDTEDWLYGEGESLSRQAYVDRLNQLKSLGDRFCLRASETVARKVAADRFGQSAVKFRKVLASCEAGEEKYNHLTDEQLNTLRTQVAEHEGWVYQQLDLQNSRPLTEDPSLKSEQIVARQNAMEMVCSPIINTPKPEPPPPPPEPESVNHDHSQTNNANSKSTRSKAPNKGMANEDPKAASAKPTANSTKKNEDMDLD